MNILHHFVFLEPDRSLDTAIQAEYDLGLVLLSVLLAIFSSYIAFLVSKRIRRSKQQYNFLWLWAGALALGGGIWAMHFIGMLAYKLPFAVNYDVTTTIISILPAILSSLIVLKTTHDKDLSTQSIVWCSVLIGSGIGLMHYIGMAAMLMEGVMRYDLWLFISSVVIAVVLAGISLRFKLKADRSVTGSDVFSVKLFIPAVIMGCAISTMHYVGMAAMFVFPGSVEHAGTSAWSTDDLVNVITIITLSLGALLLVAIEVSNRFDLYQKIKDSEQDLAITLNSIGDAVISTDVNGLITRMNPVAEQLTGWSSIDTQGKHLKSVFTIIDASTREPIADPVDKIISTGETVHISNHTTLIAKDGHEYQIADSAAPIRDDDGNIKGMVLVFNDVTEQYKLRVSANKNRQVLQAIMNNSPAVIYVKDTDGYFTFINQKFENVFHIQMKDIAGKTLHDIFPKDTADKMQIIDKAVLKSGHVLESEEIFQHDDSPHTYDSIKFPLFNEDGDIYAACGISTDITDKLKSIENSAKLQHQLHQAQKMDALGKLTGGVAHDYNNMLGVVIGYAELLEGALSAQPKLAKYAQEIIHAGQRGAKLTRKLLAFSKKTPSEESSVDLNSLLHNDQHMLEKTLTVRIKLVLDLAEDLWPTWLDDSDMEDAILNMSINAMHAIEGNGQLTIQTRNKTLSMTDAEALGLTSGDYVLLNITDTGQGMDEATREKIFEPFFSTKGDKGTGLGLSQVYGFLQRSSGAINVHSELNQGTRFALYLPRYYKNDIGTTSSIDYSKPTLVGNESILVVDDERALLSLTCEILNQNGFTVIPAESAREALAILEHETVDLLISDVLMPEMDGYQLAAIVKEKYPDIKIQLASGYVSDCGVVVADEILQQNLLCKPVKSKDLLQKVSNLLDAK